MYTGWNIILPLLTALILQTGAGYSLFKVHALSDTPKSVHPNVEAKRIAIIGAGAAGASTAFHLQKFASESGVAVNITVFEKSAYIGGRSTTVNAYGNPLEPVELGASIFVEVNTILKNATELFGLKPQQSSETDDDEDDETLGIWNGQSFVFTQKAGGWKYWDIAKMLWKYGWAPVRTQKLVKATFAKFLKLYEAPFFPFRSLTERAIDLGLVELTGVTGEQLLKANNIGPPFTTDIIQASTRVNYAQNLNAIHGLETMVCMAIEGAMQISGGNWQIFSNMISSSNSDVHLNTTVTYISKSHGKYNIKTSFSSSSGSEAVIEGEEPFDTIVLAAPFQFSSIETEHNLLRYIPDEIPYVRLHVTLFTSPYLLSPLYFNLAADQATPNTILTTLQPDETLSKPNDSAGSAGFFSISTLRTITNPKTGGSEYLYKIFSPNELTAEFLSGILGVNVPTNLTHLALHPSDSDAITWYYPHVWHSYPYELPRVTFEESELARGFYYTSGMESFISTMETSALMGMNVARLVIDDYLLVLQEEKERGAKGEQAVLKGDL